MYQIENFALSTSRAVAFRAKAGCVIRVTAGRLWLTVQGHPHDFWLQAGERWTVPAVNAVVWLSAEPSASFQMAHAIAPRGRWSEIISARRMTSFNNPMPMPSPWS